MQLIKIEQTNFAGEEKLTISARMLHEFLEVKTRFNDWIHRKILSYQFAENKDYVIDTQFRVTTPMGGGTGERDYFLSINMGKELCMLENNEKGKQARLYFIEVEDRYRTEVKKHYIPKTYAEALQLAYQQQLLIEEKQKQLDEAKPKVDSFDRFIDSNGNMSMGDAAKSLGIGRNKLFSVLRAKEVLIPNGRSKNSPYQKYIDQGLFVVKQNTIEVHEGENRTFSVTLVTTKGLQRIEKFLTKNKGTFPD